jgi:NADH-quinone oxidoreductase subunit C
MNQQEIRDKLFEQFGGDVIKGEDLFRDQISLTVDRSRIISVCRFLKEDPDLAFDFLSFVGAVDKYPSHPRFEVLYQVYSLRNNHRFRIKALVDETESDPAAIDSMVPIWPTADWHERETSEMFGITFKGHPDPRKLLLPEEWTCHPLRKDFPVEGNDEETPDLPRKVEQGS